MLEQRVQVGNRFLAVAAAELAPGAAPARIAVIAMGKTGAKELNYLSDVDVIFLADHPQDAPPAMRRGCSPPRPSWLRR